MNSGADFSGQFREIFIMQKFEFVKINKKNWKGLFKTQKLFATYYFIYRHIDNYADKMLKQ